MESRAAVDRSDEPQSPAGQPPRSFYDQGADQDDLAGPSPQENQTSSPARTEKGRDVDYPPQKADHGAFYQQLLSTILVGHALSGRNVLGWWL